MFAKAKITKGGKISIPAVYRKYFNFKDGSEVIFSIKNNQVIISPLSATLENIRKLINKYHDKNESLVDRLIAERRQEAQNG
ncbi:MAG: AbrB/MazE/SpoVT family DNA-binding domain-containing protein [Proteobacteria bacterium]|nr:AbrB/MazE/SpoVT family DNA-binding domain-containing protein [Pseudomonadota bacterium]